MQQSDSLFSAMDILIVKKIEIGEIPSMDVQGEIVSQHALMGNYLSEEPVQQAEPVQFVAPKYEYRPSYSHSDGLYHCGCGSILANSSIEAHLRTVKHQRYTIVQNEARQARLLRGESAFAPSAPSRHLESSNKRAKPNPKNNPNDQKLTYPRHILELILQHHKECPVCLEEMTVDTIHMTSCGHSACKTCSTKLDKCPICRNASL
jgi:hypothetical protein